MKCQNFNHQLPKWLKIPCCKRDVFRLYKNYHTKIIPMIDTMGKNVTFGKINLLESNRIGNSE